ncbi:nickel-binding protein [Streptomyces sp. NPDC012421]|uniref:nickel-binding protein n=1 Tax=unclassified Streptomyces TaxID=2593676 RepID=UPI0036D1F754
MTTKESAGQNRYEENSAASRPHARDPFLPALKGGAFREKSGENHGHLLGVHFQKAWADPASGTVYCLSTGPSADAVQRIHQRTGHAADEIHEVPLMV